MPARYAPHPPEESPDNVTCVAAATFRRMVEVSQLHVEANGVRFTCVPAGDADHPLALCLHGFPDSAQTWRHRHFLHLERPETVNDRIIEFLS
jgi:hypothetical protein